MIMLTFKRFFSTNEISKIKNYIYVLKLLEDKYYVGKSSNPTKRIDAHRQKRGAAFTKIYNVESVQEIKEMNSIFDEDNTVKQYMMNFGIDNVRGGAYSQIILPQWTRLLLQNEINHIKNSCFICASPSHFMSQCPLNKK